MMVLAAWVLWMTALVFEGVEQPLWQKGKSGGSKKSIVTLRLLSKKGCKKKDHGLPYLHILFDMLIG